MTLIIENMLDGKRKPDALQLCVIHLPFKQGSCAGCATELAWLCWRGVVTDSSPTGGNNSRAAEAT